MASTTSTAPEFEATTARLREIGERIYEASRKVTGAYVDGAERYISGLTRAERRLGEQAAFEPFSALLKVHAELTDDLTKASFSAARELIAA